MKPLALALSLCSLGLAPAALAQSSAPAATLEAREQGAAWVSAFPPFDPALCRTYAFTEHWSGGKQVGSTTLVVTPAPAGSGAIYRAVLTRRLRVGLLRTTVTEVALLDRTLARVAGSVTTERSGLDERTETRRQGERWVHTGRTVYGEAEVQLAADAPDHSGLLVALLLARQLGDAGPLALAGVAWPPAESFVLSDGFRPKATVVMMTVDPAAPFVHQGEEVACRRVCVSDGESYGQGLVLMVDAEGEVREFWGDGEPTRAVAEGADDAAPRRDLGEGPDAAACRALVELWIDVTCGAREPSALDPAVDWAALQAGVPAAAEQDPAAFREAVKARLISRAAAIHVDLAAHYKNFVVITRLDGGGLEGELFGAFDQTPFAFRQQGGVWRIVAMPLAAPW